MPPMQPARRTAIHPGRPAQRRRRRAARRGIISTVGRSRRPTTRTCLHHDLDDEAKMCHLDVEYWRTAAAVH